MDRLEKLKLDFLTGIEILKSRLFVNNSEIYFKNIQIWKEVLKIVNVEERHYIDAYQELLDELNGNPKHIETFWEDFETIIQHLETMIKMYKDTDLPVAERSCIWASITLPITLLAVMWIYNHPKFNGNLYEFEDTEHFEPLREVLK